MLQFLLVIFLFQSKLNCEVLDEDLAFEVRWAVAGDSVVIQLVAKLGENKLLTHDPQPGVLGIFQRIESTCPLVFPEMS